MNQNRRTSAAPKSAHNPRQKPGLAASQNRKKPAPPKYDVTRRKAKIASRQGRQATEPQRKITTRRQQNRQVTNGRNLPAGTQTQALHFPERRGNMDERLKERSPWYQSITDPLHGADCKIPDDVGDETGTVQCVLRDTVTVSAAKTCGVRVNTPYPCDPAVPVSKGYSQMDALGTPNNPIWGDGAPWPTTLGLIAYTQGVRVVSFGMYVQPECSLADCSGEMTFWMRPMELQLSGNSYDQYMNLYGSTTFAINTVSPMMMRWFPYSREEQTFEAFYAPDATGTGPGELSVPNWEMGFMTNGVPQGVTFRVTIAINYEFLPLQNAVNILDGAPSPTDITEMDLVESWVAEEPAAHTISENQISRPPDTVQPQHGDNDVSGFGMFVDVLGELLPYAMEGLAMIL